MLLLPIQFVISAFQTRYFAVAALGHRHYQTTPKMSAFTLQLATKDSEGNNQQEIHFVTNTWCPFAQKAWIALEASHCQYQMREVSLYGTGGKPDWFWELNPKGTVPVVVVQEGDTKIILDDSEYILDAVMDGRIRGDGRMVIDSESEEEVRQITEWRNKISKQLIPVGKSAILGGSRSKLQNLLNELDSLVVGPYLTGEKFTVADAATFPFLWRLDKEYGLGKDGTTKLHAWLERCLQDENVRKTIPLRGWWWWW